MTLFQPELQQSLPPLSIDAVYELVGELIQPISDAEQLSLGHALGRLVAADIRSRVPLPNTDNSAMDGYGISAADLGRTGEPLAMVGRIVAGDTRGYPALERGQAVYLATGAPVPSGVAAVVMHEHAARTADGVLILQPPKEGENIRRHGEDVQIGSTLVSAGTVIDHRHVAILAAAGEADVSAIRRVRVALLTSGDELVDAGKPLGSGQIYDVDTPMLIALLARPFIEAATPIRLPDDKGATAAALRVSAGADLILTTGGAAGSDTDHTAAAIREAGGEAQSIKLALRPGKPIIIGRLGHALIIGLPGNPTAAMIGFLLFARPALMALAGAPLLRARGYAGVADEALEVKAGRVEFAPAAVTGRAGDGRLLLKRLGKGGSSRLRPLVEADGLLELASDRDSIPAGTSLTFHPFSAPFAAW